VGDNPRIEDLRRRIQQDPASIAFAQLAEEHRRAGDYEEAVRVCRAGLAQHPAYLSAHVTLGRALMELREYDEAEDEFKRVLAVAPDNLIALRSMAELHQRREDAPPPAPAEDEVAPTEFALAPTEEEIAPAEAEIGLAPTETESPPLDGPYPEALLNFDTAVAEFNTVFGVKPDPVLEELEGWLTAILAERDKRSRGSKEQDPPH
jgi:tetratricopeptide (TPR) repeat protein